MAIAQLYPSRDTIGLFCLIHVAAFLVYHAAYEIVVFDPQFARWRQERNLDDLAWVLSFPLTDLAALYGSVCLQGVMAVQCPSARVFWLAAMGLTALCAAVFNYPMISSGMQALGFIDDYKSFMLENVPRWRDMYPSSS